MAARLSLSLALVAAALSGTGAASVVTGVPRTSEGRDQPVAAPLLPGGLGGRSSDLESGGFRDFDEANTQRGRLSVVALGAADGRRSAQAVFGGGKGVGFARALWFVDWREGETVCYGASFRLPAGFATSIRGTVDLLRWDNYADDPVNTDHGGLTVWRDGGLRLLSEQLGRNDYRVLLGPRSVPEGRWVRLVVQQRLHPGALASSVVYVDGRQVGRTSAPNTYGRRVTAVRYGVVAVDAARQTAPVGLRFDDAFYRDGPCTTGDL